jgi:hypothetical protein
VPVVARSIVRRTQKMPLHTPGVWTFLGESVQHKQIFSALLGGSPVRPSAVREQPV